MRTEDLLFEKLTKDMRAAASGMTRSQARYLVDAYYTTQDARIRAAGQERALVEAGEPAELVGWMAENHRRLEGWLKIALDIYSASHPVGMWARSVVGVGPVIAAGLLAHIDVTKAATAGAVWRFAGLDPTATWEKGERRPWNADLKVLTAYKLGESFVKTSGREDAFYGKIYREHKAKLVEKNEAGEFRDEAERILATRKVGADTDLRKALEAGKLAPSHLHARARRYAVKLFLAHFFEVAYRHEYGAEPPAPYPIAHMGHVHRIPVPNAEKAA